MDIKEYRDKRKTYLQRIRTLRLLGYYPGTIKHYQKLLAFIRRLYYKTPPKK